MSVTAKAHPSLLLHVYTHFSFLHTHSLLPIPNLVFLLTPTHTHTLSLLCVLMMLEHCNTSNTSILAFATMAAGCKCKPSGLSTRQIGRKYLPRNDHRHVHPQQCLSRQIAHTDKSPKQPPEQFSAQWVKRMKRDEQKGRRESVSDVRRQEPPLSAKFKWNCWGRAGPLLDAGRRYIVIIIPDRHF